MGHDSSNLFASIRDIKSKGKQYWQRLQQHNDAVVSNIPSRFTMRHGEPRELVTVVDLFGHTDWADNMVKESHITRDDLAAAAFIWYFDVRSARSTVLAKGERAVKTDDRTLWSADVVVAQRWIGDEEASQDPVCIQAQKCGS